MCLLCEELWMPFELAAQPKPRTFVADAPEPDGAGPVQDSEPEPPPIPEKSGGAGRP
jgi:hypothetical protein